MASMTWASNLWPVLITCSARADIMRLAAVKARLHYLSQFTIQCLTDGLLFLNLIISECADMSCHLVKCSYHFQTLLFVWLCCLYGMAETFDLKVEGWCAKFLTSYGVKVLLEKKPIKFN